MPAIFKISDGTTEIDLISPEFGFHLNDWIPVAPGYKGGGTFRSSPLASGRRLVDKQFDNIVETLDLKVNDVSQDAIIRDFQNLRRLLEKAADYWTTDWQNDPVWIEARATCETNTRYAIIYIARVPEDDNPFAQPFLQPKSITAMDNITLLIEHGTWTENIPGTQTAIEISAVETYDGRNLGNVNTMGVRDPTTDDEVYFANKQNRANLTDIYYWDSAGGAWSANLMDAVLPFDLFQNPVAAGDVIVFGIDITLTDSGPFCSLVFDLVTAQNDLTTVVWRYSDAGADPTAWAALTVQDYTNAAGAMTGDAFDTAGVNSVHWSQPTGWATQNPRVGAGPAVGITGYWVAAHVTVVGASPTPPTQQNRDIYSITWAYTEVQAAQVGGDIPSLARSYIDNLTGTGGLAADALSDTRIIVGLRTHSRGPDFSAYLNISDDDQNPTGVTTTRNVAAVYSWVNRLTTPTGRALLYSPAPIGAATNFAGAVSFTLNNTIAPDYYGEYHVFMRGFQDGGAVGDWMLRAGVALQERGAPGTLLPAPGYFTNEDTFTSTTIDWQLLDFGTMTIPPTSAIDSSEVTSNLYIYVQIRATRAISVPGDVYFYDLILMPVDEWAADVLHDPDWACDGAVNMDEYLDIDSIAYPKHSPRTFIRELSNDRVFSLPQLITNGDHILQANSRQKLWFLIQSCKLGDTREAEIEITNKVRVFRNQQYQSMRGDR
jgi:hypothetical protein